MKNLLYVFIGMVLLSSCGDMNQELIIPYEGDTEYKFSMDLGSIMSMAGAVADEMDEEKEEDIDISAIMNNPDKMPSKVDTTILFGSEEFTEGVTLNDREKYLMNKVSMRLDTDKEQEKMLMEFSIKYADLNEKTETLNLISRVTREQKIMKGDTIGLEEEGPNKMLDGIADYILDKELGKITFLDSEVPEEMDKMTGKEKDVEVSPEDLAMMAMMMPGGINTKIVLPGKVFSVKGTENYKIIDENTVVVTTKYVDMIKEGAIKGYSIEYDSGKPISDPKVTEVWDPEPVAVVARDRSKAPSDAIVLFADGDASGFRHYDGSEVKWKVGKKELTAEPGTGDIRSKKDFGSCQLHLEWKSPKEPNKKGQDKGNSGVYFDGKYEVQILNSFENRTYSNGQAGAVYKQHIPLVNATSPTGDWNTYDIIYHAPEFDEDGAKTKSGTLTVIHNGVLIQDHVEIQGTTEYIGRPKNIAHGPGPIILQEHNNYVSYRNVWVRPL